MLSTEVLQTINRDPTAIFLRHEKKSPQALGKEGALIRSSILNLHTAECLIKWKLTETNDPTNEEILTELLKGKSRQGLKTFLPQEKLKNNNATDTDIYAFLDAICENNSAFTELLPVIGQNIFQLFDFNYYEYKISLFLEKKLTLNEKNNFLQLISMQGAAIVFNNMEHEKKLLTYLVEIDFEIQLAAPTIITRHLVIILHHVFPTVSGLEWSSILVIVETFFNLLQNHMEWPEKIFPDIKSIVLTTMKNHHLLIKKENLGNPLALFGVTA